jgi:hypothetical protein
MLKHPAVRRLALLVLLAALVTGCARPLGPDATGPDLAPADPSPAPPDVEPDGPGQDADDGTDVGTEPPIGDADPATGAGTTPLAGEPSTRPVTAEGTAGLIAVVDVRVATHDGFDRLVFETAGDRSGRPGWMIAYTDVASSQGSGDPVAVGGGAVLSVSLTNIAIPYDLPAGVEPWAVRRLTGPSGGIIVEVVDDGIFEGYHAFFVGVDRERPFLVQRLSDPERVVIDIFHGG